MGSAVIDEAFVVNLLGYLCLAHSLNNGLALVG